MVKIVVGLSGGGETLFGPFLFPALVVGRDGNFGSVNIQNSGLGIRWAGHCPWKRFMFYPLDKPNTKYEY